MVYSESEQRLLALLRSHPILSTLDLRELGFFNPNTVVHSLRKKGILIKTYRRKALGTTGKIQKGIAHYSLEEKGSE